jgi:hypothetical protein
VNSEVVRPAAVPQNSWFLRTGLPILAGTILAATCCLLQNYISVKWLILAAIGIGVAAASLVVKDSQKYWLSLFLVSLVLDIHKDFLPKTWSDYFLGTFSLPWGTATLLLQLSDIPFMFLILLWLRKQLNRREPIYWPLINVVPMAFLAWATLGVICSPYPLLGFLELVRQVKFVGMYTAAANMFRMKRVARVVVLMLLVQAVIQGGVTIGRYKFQFLGTLLGETFGKTDPMLLEETVTSEAEGTKRGLGTFNHPNMTAMHFELVLPIALILFLGGATRGLRTLGFGVLALGAGALVLTFSRGGMLGFVAACLVSVYLCYSRRMVPRSITILLVLSGMLLAPVAAMQAEKYFTTRQEYYEERWSHLNAGRILMGLNPILGTGLNTSTALRVRLARKEPQPIDELLPLHNHYLIALSEIGVVGFLLYSGFFLYITIQAWKMSRRTSGFMRVLAIGVVAAYTSLAVHMNVDFLHPDALHTMLWFYAGLIMAQRRSEDEARAISSKPGADPGAAGEPSTDTNRNPGC